MKRRCFTLGSHVPSFLPVVFVLVTLVKPSNRAVIFLGGGWRSLHFPLTRAAKSAAYNPIAGEVAKYRE